MDADNNNDANTVNNGTTGTNDNNGTDTVTNADPGICSSTDTGTVTGIDEGRNVCEQQPYKPSYMSDAVTGIDCWVEFPWCTDKSLSFSVFLGFILK